MTHTWGRSYINCQSKSIYDMRYNLMFIPGPLKTIDVPLHFKHRGAIKETGISANYPVCSAFTVLTKQ